MGCIVAIKSFKYLQFLASNLFILFPSTSLLTQLGCVTRGVAQLYLNCCGRQESRLLYTDNISDPSRLLSPPFISHLIVYWKEFSVAVSFLQQRSSIFLLYTEKRTEKSIGRKSVLITPSMGRKRSTFRTILANFIDSSHGL